MSFKPYFANQSRAGTAQFSSSNFTVSAGVVNATSSAGARSWTLISTNTVPTASSAITFSSISPNYKLLQLRFSGVNMSVQRLRVSFSTDNFATSLNVNGYTIFCSSASTSSSLDVYAAYVDIMSTPTVISNLAGVVTLNNFGTESFKSGDAGCACDNAAYPQSFAAIGFNVYSLAPINAIRIQGSSGSNITSGNFRLYGL